MWVLVCYDVNTETAEGRKRLARVAQICQGFGQRVQKSVFECEVDAATLERMRQRLLRVIRLKEDSLRIYKLPARREQVLEVYGVERYVDFTGPLVI